MPCGVDEWPSGTGAESAALAEAVAGAGAEEVAAAGFVGADAETAEVLDAEGAGLRAAITTLPAAADGFAGEAPTATAAAGVITTRAPALAVTGMALADTPVGAATLLVGVEDATGLDTSELWPLPPARIWMTPPPLLPLALLAGALPAAVAAAGRLAMVDSCECVWSELRMCV